MIGDRIRQRRLELGLTQLDLAKRMGYKSKSTINKVENGINDVNQSTIVKYAKALETTVAYLMGWDNLETNNTIKKKFSELQKCITTNDTIYYLDKETAKLAQEMSQSPLLNTFLSSSRKLSPEQLEIMQEMVYAFLRKDGKLDE